MQMVGDKAGEINEGQIIESCRPSESGFDSKRNSQQ